MMAVQSFAKDILSPEDATKSFERVEFVLQDRGVKPSAKPVACRRGADVRLSFFKHQSLSL